MNERTVALASPISSVELQSLLRAQAEPRGWKRAVAIVMLLNVLSIVACIALGLWMYGNTWHYFNERKLGTYFAVAGLIASSVVCFQIAGRLHGAPLRSFWIAFGVLLVLASADDMFTIHERIDKFVHTSFGWDPKDPLTDHLDDVLVASYVVPALYLAWRYRRELLQAVLMVQVLAVAMLVFLTHLLLDVLYAPPAVEESVKQTACCFILLAFIAVRMDNDLLVAWRDPASGSG